MRYLLASLAIMLGWSSAFMMRPSTLSSPPLRCEKTKEDISKDPQPAKVINCETEGSCRTTRVAYKKELEEQRQRKRAEGADFEQNYLVDGAPPPRKSYSPFGRKTS